MSSGDSSRGTAAERVPCAQDVMDSNLVGLFSLLLHALFLLVLK